MRSLLIGLTLLLTTTSDRAADRQALLVADSTLALEGASFTDSASYLHPGSPLVRGASYISTFLTNARIARGLQREPVFADVSADGSLGYTWGWTHFEATRGKYLACWRKTANGWRLAAFAGTVPVPDSAPVHLVGRRDSTPPVRAHANPRELLKADSAFAATSRAQGAKQAFLTYAADNAVSFGAGVKMNEGREAIGAAFDNLPAGAVLEWRPVAVEIAKSGDLGCTVGEATISSLHHYSKYLTIWKRQPDKTWKFVADGGNLRPAPALVH